MFTFFREPRARLSGLQRWLILTLLLLVMTLVSSYAPVAHAEGAPAVTTEDMILYWLPNAQANKTVCNDGSAAGYYWRPGSGDGVNRWVIFLQGGGMCNDNASCDARQDPINGTPGLMTNRNWPPTEPGEGILSPSDVINPDFYNANHVYVRYCSSDSWSGDRPASPATGGYAFRGKRIVRAVINALMDPAITPSPNLAEARDVLFTGTSAGGCAVLVHLDWLAGVLPQATVRGIDDAGWLQNIEPFDKTLPWPSEQLAVGYAFWNGWVDNSCAAAYPGSPSLCYFGIYAYPHLAAEMAVQAAQRDMQVLTEWYGITDPTQPDQETYINEVFAPAVRDSLATVTVAFSPAGTNHGLLSHDTFHTLLVNGYSLEDIVGNWEFGRPGPLKVIGEW
ncbi:MAG: pectin acetylesterase-family hydrolase [Chloroflexota bacterium]